MTETLHRPIEKLDGVGPTRARHLRALGIATLGHLLEYFPRTYQFESGEKSIAALTAGDAIQQARGRVVAVDYIPSRPKARFEATLADEQNQKLGLTWFNGGYLRRLIHPDLMIRVQGKVRVFRGIPQMANP